MTKQKIYIGKDINTTNMFPSDLKGSLDDLFQIYFRNMEVFFYGRLLSFN